MNTTEGFILAGPPCCRNTELHWFYTVSCRFQTEVNLKFGAYGKRKIKINKNNWNQQLHVTATRRRANSKQSSHKTELRVVLTRRPFLARTTKRRSCWIYTSFSPCEVQINSYLNSNSKWNIYHGILFENYR